MRGIIVDVMDEALHRRMGLAIIHSGYSWEKAQELVMSGKGDAFVTTPTPERMSYTNISSEPVMIPTFTMFVNRKNPRLREILKVEKISDLKKFRLGHYAGSGWAKQHFAGTAVNWFPDVPGTLKMLARARFDVFIDVSQVIRYNIKRMGLRGKIMEIPKVLDSTSFNFCVGKKSVYADILPKFDKTLREMRNDGTLQEIYDRYR